MNKQMEMGKTMFEVMKMRKNNKQNPFPLRKYYGAMIIGFVFFLGIMAYYSATALYPETESLFSAKFYL